MIKALMVVTLMSGAEYSVNMPSMESCLKNAKLVTDQSEMVDVICIPRADKSAKMKDMFTMFGDLVERMQENLETSKPFDGFEGSPKCGSLGVEPNEWIRKDMSNPSSTYEPVCG